MKGLTDAQINVLLQAEQAYHARGEKPGSPDIVRRVCQLLRVPEEVELQPMKLPMTRVHHGDAHHDVYARTQRCRLVRAGEDPAQVIADSMLEFVSAEVQSTPADERLIFMPYIMATEWQLMEGDSRRAFVYRAGTLRLPRH